MSLSVRIVGGGPTGALLACFLRRRGLRVTLYEARPDPRSDAGQSGRSINLALADRGINALKSAGVYDDIVGSLVALRGRLIHAEDGTQSLQLYGQRTNEVIYSVSRERLSQALLDVATRAQTDIRFQHRLEALDFDGGTAQIRDLAADRVSNVPMTPLLAADGAASVTRRRMAEFGFIDAREVDLEHGYKELSIPAAPDGDYVMAKDVLHIWPRGNFMLIALPNVDGSFTATLFLRKHGAVSFDALSSPATARHFLRTHFADVFPLMPGCAEEFQRNPTGFLGTVYADPWHVKHMAALVGDAAHAMVPFHGQGMNCCFEDCLEFDACMATNDPWEILFERFHASRKPNTDAIAAMALDNYLEMRERVVDPSFRLQQALALELERRHPGRFIPRYSMVTFHHEIPYLVARQRGMLQARLLAELSAGASTLEDIDYDEARREINRQLPPIPRADPR